MNYFEDLMEQMADPKVKHTHVTSRMITEGELNALRKKFIVVRVPSMGGQSVMYMVCKG